MYIFTVSRRQIRRGVVFLFTLIVLAVMTATLGNRSWSTAAEADLPLQRAVGDQPRVALTFDVTWGTEELARLLETLNSQGVKATFFLGGTFLRQHGDVARKMATDGHEVGTLGQKIVNLSELSEREVSTNLLASQSALAKLLGGPVRYFRPPLGPATPAVVRAARSAELITVTYSLDSQDHLGLTADQIARRVVQRAEPGDIILLTASDWSTETPKALPDVIQGLKKRGFELVRVSDLVPQEGPRSR